MPVAKRRETRKKKTEDKPVPLPCKCGRDPAIVKLRGGYVVSCSDPLNCCGNFMTYRKKLETQAIIAWNDRIRYGGENR